MSDSVKDFVAGTVGGFAGKLLDYPADTIKVLLQTQGSSSKVYRGAWHAFTHTVETKGIAALYKGITSPLLGSMAENALLFWSYGLAKKAMGEEQLVAQGRELSLLQLSLAGAVAGATVPLVLTPVELIKCRLQVQSSAAAAGFRNYKGPMDVRGQPGGKNDGHCLTCNKTNPYLSLSRSLCKRSRPKGLPADCTEAIRPLSCVKFRATFVGTAPTKACANS